MSIDDVAAALRAALAKIAEGLTNVNVAALHTDEARTLVEQATAGTSNPHAPQSTMLLAGVLEELVRLHGLAQAATQAIEAYLANVASGADSTPTKNAPQTAASSHQRRPPTVPADRIEQLRRELPPDITPSTDRRPGTPQPKTHGRWIDPTGQVHEEVSGWDDKYRAALQWFKAQPKRRLPSTASDVEVKLAVHMRQNNIEYTTLTINHVPCEGEFGCDTLVPQILPEGYTLVVHGAGGFHKVYHGRAK